MGKKCRAVMEKGKEKEVATWMLKRLDTWMKYGGFFLVYYILVPVDLKNVHFYLYSLTLVQCQPRVSKKF